MTPELCVVRGGGDLATGVVWRLTRAGWPVIVCELSEPLTVRRLVAMSSAVFDEEIEVEGMVGRLAETPEAAVEIARSGEVGVVVSPSLPQLGDRSGHVVVDARIAKRNLDTRIDDGELVIGLGPGFTAGYDCHAVVETKRGHHLGRVLWEGAAARDTGTPGLVAGKGKERVLRSPKAGPVSWNVSIGDQVADGQWLGSVADLPIMAPFEGVVRGLIMPGVAVRSGTKIGDIDARNDPSACHEISDKALAVGGAVVEAVHSWRSR
ncbi:MAG: selenium-dependent molybdenum cofactor biosynthesis protein YqeB [Acidimicrobiales bacterium]